MDNKVVVKISISSSSDYYHIDDVIYYRSGLTADFVTRWLWYFEYLAARVKVSHPKCKVVFYKGPQTILLGREWHDHRRNAMIKSRNIKLKKLNSAHVIDDFFHFASDDHKKNIDFIKNQIQCLMDDTFPIPEFPEYINKIKSYL